MIHSKIHSIQVINWIIANASIAQSLDEESINAFKFMDDEEINELIEIRKRTKQLAYKLKNKLNSK